MARTQATADRYASTGDVAPRSPAQEASRRFAKDKVAAIAKNDLLPFFEKTVGVDAWETRQILWDAYQPYDMWLVFTLIGLGSMAKDLRMWASKCIARGSAGAGRWDSVR